MANHLDLEEQEQLDQLKHFWKQYGNAITWALIVILSGFAAWNGYNYWQRSEAVKAAAIFDELERGVQAGDTARMERALADIQSKFGKSAYAQQGALLVARYQHEHGKPEQARAALQWVADRSEDKGYQAVARLRLAGLMMEAKQFDQALSVLSVALPGEFEALASDRRGDVLHLQGKTAEAVAQYQKAYAGLSENASYRRMVEVKLNALGVNVQADAKPKG
jgi:predicted negative regulator of RcsB-dependent stress response